MKKEKVHLYEIYVRSPRHKETVLQTCSIREARRAYSRIVHAGGYPRLSIDGIEQPILAADKLMSPGPGKSVPIVPKGWKPPQKSDIHKLEPAD